MSDQPTYIQGAWDDPRCAECDTRGLCDFLSACNRRIDAVAREKLAQVQPRLFTLVRKADEGGVSGTGRVLDGVLWHTGQVTICWRTDIEAKAHGYSSLGVYPSWQAFEFLHITSHPTNATEVRWLA